MRWRNVQKSRRLDGGDFDVLVVVEVSRRFCCCSGRGASVALVDRGDFGAFTPRVVNLVWGGFKYLENYELGLVYGLCRSRAN